MQLLSFDILYLFACWKPTSSIHAGVRAVGLVVLGVATHFATYPGRCPHVTRPFCHSQALILTGLHERGGLHLRWQSIQRANGSLMARAGDVLGFVLRQAVDLGL